MLLLGRLHARYADRHAEGDRQATSEGNAGAVDGCAQPFGGVDGELLVGFGQQHGEFLAPQAAEDVHVAEGGVAQVGDGLEHDVAHLVAVAVVDLLEVVDVEHEHREGAAVAVGAAELLLGALHEMAAVIHAGEVVDVCLAAEFFFEELALGDVGVGAAHARGLAVFVALHHLGLVEHPADAAVLVEHAVFELVGGGAAFEGVETPTPRRARGRRDARSRPIAARCAGARRRSSRGSAPSAGCARPCRSRCPNPRSRARSLRARSAAAWRALQGLSRRSCVR